MQPLVGDIFAEQVLAIFRLFLLVSYHFGYKKLEGAVLDIKLEVWVPNVKSFAFAFEEWISAIGRVKFWKSHSSHMRAVNWLKSDFKPWLI